MAVCGRCLICGHKFSCGREDEAVRWACTRGAECARAAEHARKACGEAFEHAICITCHDGLVNGSIEKDVALLLGLVARRSESLQNE